MKRIIDVINELDEEELILAYLFVYSPVLFSSTFDKSLSISDTRDACLKKLKSFIKSLKELTPKIGDDGECILFAYKTPGRSNNDDMETGLVYANDLLNKKIDDVKTYAYDFTPWEEAVFFLVSDSPFTKKHLINVVVSFLYEISFWGGYTQKGHKKAIDDLNKSIKELEDGGGKEHDITDLFPDYDKERDEEYPLENEFMKNIREAENNYITYCRKMELFYLKKMLKEERGKDE